MVLFSCRLVAAYSARSSAADVVIMLIFGVIGYIMRKFDFAPAAFIIAFVLAKGAEESYRQSLLLSDAGNGIFLDRPIALAFMALGLFVVIWRSLATLRTGPGAD